MAINHGVTAAQFASVLNGDNPKLILKVLKQFVRKVRRERRRALVWNESEDSGNDDDDTDMSDDDEREDKDEAMDASNTLEISDPPNKKYKKSEEWKADTASYNVPFVGTSVARGEHAPVVKGEWPTGLLKMYLGKSPLALELLNDDLFAATGPIHQGLVKKKKGKLSRLICDAHLLALAELLTACIRLRSLPEHIVNDDFNDDQVQLHQRYDSGMPTFDPKFLAHFLKVWMPRMFELLNDETDKGRGKSEISGGCGSLAAPALKVLQNVSMISTTHARLVAKHLDENLYDGVLRVFLRPLPLRKEIPSSEPDAKSAFSCKPSRTEALRLAACLLKASDAAVNTYICTGGNRERKVKPGIVYIALREGLASNSYFPSGGGENADEDEYNDTTAGLLQSVRQFLFTGMSHTSQKLLFALMTRDPLAHICRLSSCAPPLLAGKRTFEDVLSARDPIEGKASPMEKVGIESQRLLLPLLTIRSVSPFLQLRDDEQIARTLIRLLESESATLELRHFIVFCTNQNPSLLQHLLRMLAFPEPKKTFDFVSRASFISNLLRKGPPPFACLCAGNRHEKVFLADEALATILPEKLQAHIVTKSLQNGNALVKLVTLKLILAVVGRFELVKREGVENCKWDDHYIDALSSSFIEWLPDLQIILALRSRFNGFSRDKAGGLVYDFLLRVVESYISIHPSLVEGSNLDWMKLLPENASIFHRALPIVQVRVLTCFKNIIQARPCGATHILFSSRIVFDIMLSTRNRMVHRLCRVVCRNLMISALSPPATDQETLSCIAHEANCWIDAMCPSTLTFIFNILNEVLHNSLTHLSLVSQSWTKHDVFKRMHFSLLLAAALSASDVPHSFQTLLAQVTARCLLNMDYPLSLAALVSDASQQSRGEKNITSSNAVAIYSGALLQRNRMDDVDRKIILQNFVSRSFAENSCFRRVVEYLDGTGTVDLENALLTCEVEFRSQSRLIPFIRSVNQFYLFLGGGHRIKQRCCAILRRCIPRLLVYQNPKTTLSPLLAAVYRIHERSRCSKFDILDAIALSCQFSTSECFLRRRVALKSEFHCISNEVRFSSFEKRSLLLNLCLLSSNLPTNILTKIKISLISRSNTDLSEIGLQFALHFKQDQFGERNAAFDPNIVKASVDAFLLISRQVKEEGSTLVRETKADLTSMLTTIMELKNLETAAILLLMGEESAVGFVDNALDLSIENPVWAAIELHFFSTVLHYDFHRLLHPTLALLGNMGSRLSKAWEDGYLDSFIQSLFQRAKSSATVLDSFLETMAPQIVDRAIQALNTASVASVLDDSSSIFFLTADVMEASKTLLLSLDKLASELVRVISIAIQNMNLPKPGMKNLLRIGISLIRNFRENEPLPVHKSLACTILIYLFWTLPFLLKRDASVTASGLTAEDSLNFLVTLLSEIDFFDTRIRVESSLVHKVIKACLKNGLRSPPDVTNVHCLSLRLVTLLVLKSGDPGSAFSSLIFHPHDIFDMITSHSKFEDVFTCEHEDPGDGDNTQLDSRIQERVIELMISCIVVSSTEVALGQSQWKTILSSFSAGLGHLDNLIRKLGSVCPDGSLPYSDEIRWTGQRSSSQMPAPNRWDWVIDALDHSRIRATIASFPASDSLDTIADSWTFVGGTIQNCDTVNKKIALDFRDLPTRTTKSKEEIAVGNSRKKNANIKDYRYSPAVLLPSLLGALEAEVTIGYASSKLSSDPRIGLTVAPEMTSGVRLALGYTDSVQRLSETGIVSFCLMALSSSCEKIRSCAISVLGIILHAAGTIEAREKTSWRNRPQLVMILNSVQRCLVIEKACSMGGESEADSSSIPKLMPIVALFLARASLVLSRPDDALYMPVNRYFLKTEYDHGAFQDLNRLPGFMSLFCSANADTDQSRAERIWALQLLRDGLVDSACYRLAASCHAPELILSSFENVRLSRSSDETKGTEYSLLHDSLRMMVDNGGHAAHAHLLGRLGILSWIRSYCTSRSIDEAFPTSKSAISFCRLTDSVIYAARNTPRLQSRILRDEANGLAQPLASLCFIKSAPTGQGRESVFHNALEVLENIGHLLLTIQEADGMPPKDETHPLGISLEISVRILNLAKGDNDHDHYLQKRTLGLLCNLPLSLTKSSASCPDEYGDVVYTFIIQALDYCVASDSPTDGPLLRLVIERIVLLVERYDDSFAPNSIVMDSILQLLFSIRCKVCMGSEGTIQHRWLQALKLLSRYYKGEDTSLKFALDHVSSNLTKLGVENHGVGMQNTNCSS